MKLLSRWRKAADPADAADGDTISPVDSRAACAPGSKAASGPQTSVADPLGGINSVVARRQRMVLACIAAVVFAGGGSYIIAQSKGTAPPRPDDPVTIDISTDTMVGKNFAQKQWMAQSQNQIADATARVKALETTMPAVQQVSADVAALKQENEKLKADGARLFKVYEDQNSAQVARLKAFEAGGATAGTIAGAGAANPSTSRWQQPVREPFRVAGAAGQDGANGARGWTGGGNPGGPGGPGDAMQIGRAHV